MKICFYTESNHWSTPPIESCGRTDVNWMFALKADHCPLSQMPGPKEYDLGIILVPKKNPQLAFEGFERSKLKCNRWVSMQEGPAWFYQDFSIEDQMSYLNLLSQVDIIFCHNEQDKLYFDGLFPDKNVSVFQSLLIEESLPAIPHENRSGSIISGNMCSWYGGMDSFIVGRILSEQVYAPSMGRKVQGEEQIEGLTHLPYMNWQQWFLELNKRKYGVNLMRTFAAGSFSLACARLKIPCIGWGRVDENNPEGTDTQRLLFPQLTVPTGNMKEATRLANHLKESLLFYEHCAEYAHQKYWEIYSEEIFMEKFTESINK